MRTRKPTSLDVMDTLTRLCKRHDALTVLAYVKDWVAYMERQIGTMENHKEKT